ncbi:hypothetical protein SCP_1203110 [Sparassis crispa]|uniref:Uncharacterized protein n=1 Tax=Sparassis crispa TaxID=139825 RepID=A0A401H102_9APHY|nr:hypothetical protein SCP_1203110 [Sparassis crispa]GBE88082.1 hypothetical protein SCP_1203110 [Sparassis crispa]
MDQSRPRRTQGGGTLVLGDSVDPAKKCANKKAVCVYGDSHANRKTGASLFSHITSLLENGLITVNGPNRVEVLPNGLARIQDGEARHTNNEASSVKLVVHPQETLQACIGYAVRINRASV